MIQRTLVLIKPDGVKRSLTGEIISRFEKIGLKIIGMKMQYIDKEFAQKHYTEDISKRRGEKVRNNLLYYIASGPVIAICLEGVDVIEIIRKIVGDTEPKSAIPGTIRGDYSHVSYGYADDKNLPVKNLIHASANKEDAKNELKLWFGKKEIHDYKVDHEEHTLN
ncbi:MAG: nucleoside-diphosphate kinase [Candidatus Nanoarchaeia archaeon]|jgi:nucleoside-diphosphate kinase|nr:nucleoside-diphosphate kinase [Candidatus Nanoarchaeia archaeon]|tara:strand:+ start:19583 stop:20077 length:495 start_codon:yes stop_codon:yes gene_type:complete